MKIVFHASDNDREQGIAKAMFNGFKLHGHEMIIIPVGDHDMRDLHNCDMVCTFGVKGNSRSIMSTYSKLGIATLYIDKAYTRTPGYFRVSFDGFQPVDFLSKANMDDSRSKKFNFDIKDPVTKVNRVLFAGSSQKYCDFHELGDATRYAQRLFLSIRKRYGKALPIVYRPKPSWRDAAPIKKTEFSGPDRSFIQALHKVKVVVTHGSNAALEAVINGVPCISLGDSAMTGLCDNNIDNLFNPFMPTKEQIQQRLNNICYCQWNLSEMASGEAWDFIRQEIVL